MENPVVKAECYSLRRLILTYILIMLSAYAAIQFKIPEEKNSSELLSKLLVTQTTKILNIMKSDIAATCDGTLITMTPPSNKPDKVNIFTMDVQFGCNGIEAMLIYAAAVAAFPASWKRKLIGIAAGVILIHAANVLRIVALAYTGVYYPKLFQYLHVYILQGMMVAFALVIFFVYLHLNASKTA
ncbi:MAG: exosortase H [Nitrospirota bacterium]